MKNYFLKHASKYNYIYKYYNCIIFLFLLLLFVHKFRFVIRKLMILNCKQLAENVWQPYCHINVLFFLSTCEPISYSTCNYTMYILLLQYNTIVTTNYTLRSHTYQHIYIVFDLLWEMQPTPSQKFNILLYATCTFHQTFYLKIN